MRKLRKKLNKPGFLGLLSLCLLSLSFGVYAAAGSITVKVEEARAGLEVHICTVAKSDGSLLEDFAPLGLKKEQLTTESERRSSALALYEYASEHKLPSTLLKTDEQGLVRFEAPEEAIYLVWETSEGLEFSPFLVSVPTVVGDSVIYDITAEPKADEPEPPPTPTPTPGVTPGPTPPPDLPQTGTDMLPIWLLAGFGSLALIAGIVLLLPRKRKERKDA